MAAKYQPSVQRDMAKELAAAAALKEQLKAVLGEEESDAAALRDTIEGETDLLETFGAIVAQIGEDMARIEGIKKFSTTLDARSKRLDGRVKLMRAMLTNALDIIGQKKFELPIATVTLKAVPPKLKVVEEADVPADYWKQPEPVLDNAKLSAALKQRSAALDRIDAETKAAADAGVPLDDIAKARHAALLAACPPIPGAELDNGSVTVQVLFS